MGGPDFPAGKGYVRLWMGKHVFMAQKADGTITPWGCNVANTQGELVNHIDDNFCSGSSTNGWCEYTAADKVETGWQLCATMGNFNDHNEPTESECPMGAASATVLKIGVPGDPYAVVDILVRPQAIAQTPAHAATGQARSTAIVITFNMNIEVCVCVDMVNAVCYSERCVLAGWYRQHCADTKLWQLSQPSTHNSSG